MDLDFLTTGVRARGVDGALVLYPMPHEQGDDVLYSQLALFTDPEAVGNGSISFLISGRPGGASYSVLDLNHLPPDVRITLTIETSVSKSSTTFEGSSGNMPQPAEPA